jgi:cobalamin biosynthesis protein CobT
MFIQQHDCATGEITYRELTPEEIAQREADHIAEMEAKAAAEAAEQQKFNDAVAQAVAAALAALQPTEGNN